MGCLIDIIPQIMIFEVNFIDIFNGMVIGSYFSAIYNLNIVTIFRKGIANKRIQ
jgi:hypothetical protein